MSGFNSAVASEGEHSVSPYPEKHLKPSFSSTSRINVGEEAAPPITDHSTLLRSYLERAGELMSTMAMMGTRLRALTFSACTRRNTSSGRKRGSMTCVPPTEVMV